MKVKRCKFTFQELENQLDENIWRINFKLKNYSKDFKKPLT